MTSLLLSSRPHVVYRLTVKAMLFGAVVVSTAAAGAGSLVGGAVEARGVVA
jgi:hypothetical protein